MKNEKGKFIVLYGINNLGKSTQAKLLVENLQAQGHQAVYMKYPVYDLAPSGHLLNEYLREGNPHQLSSREAQLIYAMNRYQYEPNLKNLLDSGVTVIAEDYKGTGIAWGMGGGVDKHFLMTVNSNLLEEDLAFLFQGERFTEGIEDNHKHEQDNELTQTVQKAHQELAGNFGWIHIDANRDKETIQQELLTQILKLY
jgi:thymidylate kinase